MHFYLNFRNWLEKRRLWEAFIYLFFGGLATIVNFTSFFVAQDVFQFGLIISNSLSWFAAVLFAFITNKLWVFHSKTDSYVAFFKEFSKFIFYRVVSYFMDMGCMIILINGLAVGDFWSKLITQVIVVIANYIFSKVFIFKGDGTKAVRLEKDTFDEK